MGLLRTFLSRLVSLFRRQHLDAALQEELRAHIDLATEENITLGMSRKQARTVAMRSLGGVAQTTETYRLQRGMPFFEILARDLRFGIRQLHRSPGFAATAIFTLALGLGANTAVFSLINALLLRPLAVSHAEQLVIVRMDRSDSDLPNYGFNAPLFRTLEKHHEVFEHLGASFHSSLQVRGTTGNQQIPGLLVSGQFFQVLETPPLMGRYITPEDDQARGASAGFGAVVSEPFWRTWFNSAPDVVGRKLMIANMPFTVIGVMPREFIGSDPTYRPEIFVPLSAEPIIDAPYNMIEAGFHANWLDLIGRLRPKVSREKANAALQVASISIYEDSNADADRLKDARTNHVHFTIESGSKGYTYFRELFWKPLVVVFCLCGAMLLLACFNLASLLMARAAARERELATRMAIGATKGRLIQQLLVETLLIAGLGTAAGLAVSPLVSRGLAALLLSKERDTILNTSLDLRVFAFAAVLTAVASLLIGLIPALRATSGDLNDHLKSGSQARSRRDKRSLLPNVLMASEVALALLLVVGASLLASSVTRLYRTGLGFNPNGIVDLQLNMDKQSLDGNALLLWYQQFAEALGHQPGVESVSYESQTPLSGSTRTNTLKTSVSNGDQMIYMNAVAPDYFATMRIPMLAGRDFRWQDSHPSGKKIILNQSAAKFLFPNQNPVGRFVSDYDNKQSEVIAVVGDVKYRSIRAEDPPGAYEAITLGPDEKRSYTVVVRIKGYPVPLGEGVRTLAARMAPDIPTPVMTSMSNILDASISSERMMAMLAVFFAACALLVTAIGLYGTLAYATARRTSEIGIRMALGAQRLQVVTLVFRENAWIAICGSLAGLAAALLASRALSSFLYGTSARDPWVLVGSVAALISTASAASLLPAIRAARIEPMEALRAE
jgi:predicted permease